MILLQITDTHLVEDGLCLGAVDTGAYLTAAIDAVLRWPFRPDAILHTGDISEDGSVRSYERFAHQIGRLGVPVFAVPGNHDVRDTMRAVLAPSLSHLPHSGFLHYRAPFGPLDLIGLDTVDETSAAGRLCPERLRFAEQALAGSRGRPTLVLMHHPPSAVGFPFADRIACADGDALAPLVRKDGAVQAVLAGHAHRTVVTTFAGVPLMVCGSPAHQFALATSDDQPIGFVMEPPTGLLHVWLEQEKRLVSHVVPLGDHGPVQPFPSA